MINHLLQSFKFAAAALIAAALTCCAPEPSTTVTKTMEVRVTAYNALAWQTTAVDSDIAAWGDTLKPGMKAVAVSRDLIALGLKHGATVRIEGLEGEYTVLDKMNRRYTKRIDLFMGIDVDAAREWGVQKRTIEWEVERESKYDKRYQYTPPDSLTSAR